MFKKLFLGIALFLFISIGLILFDFWKFKKTTEELYVNILNNRTADISKNLIDFQNKIYKYKKIYTIADKITKNKLTKKLSVSNELFIIDNLIPKIKDLIAINGEKTYYLLLQNNMELRPTGGFLGSYAKLKFVNGGLSKLTVQDIYFPDGQIQGHVDPPPPIQEAFKQGWFRLRDSNWNPDFPSASETIGWFFEKGGEEKSDGMIGINLNLMKDLLSVTGPLFLLNFKETVTSDNLYQVAQQYSELNFYPGSMQKTEIMTSLGNAFIEKIRKLQAKSLLMFLSIVEKNFDEKQIVAYFNDPGIQKNIRILGWDGSISRSENKEKRDITDYLYLVESNLGANKANCCIEREVFHQIEFSEENSIKESVTIVYNNTSPLQTTIKPYFWGGDYRNYLRILFPQEATGFKVSIDGKFLEADKILSEKTKQSIQSKGFFVQTKALLKSTVVISYEIPFLKTENQWVKYFLKIQKQPGIEEIPYSLVFAGDCRGISDDNWINNENKCEFRQKIRQDKEISVIFRYTPSL